MLFYPMARSLELICYAEIAGLLALWWAGRLPWGLVLALGALCWCAAIRAAEERATVRP